MEPEAFAKVNLVQHLTPMEESILEIEKEEEKLVLSNENKRSMLSCLEKIIDFLDVQYANDHLSFVQAGYALLHMQKLYGFTKQQILDLYERLSCRLTKRKDSEAEKRDRAKRVMKSLNNKDTKKPVTMGTLMFWVKKSRP